MKHGFRFYAPAWGACPLCLLLAIAGCESINKARAVKNPVAPPPPTRYANLPGGPEIIAVADAKAPAAEGASTAEDGSETSQANNLRNTPGAASVTMMQPSQTESNDAGPAAPIATDVSSSDKLALARKAGGKLPDRRSAPRSGAAGYSEADDKTSVETVNASEDSSTAKAASKKVVMAADAKNPQLTEKLDDLTAEPEQAPSGEVAALVNGTPIFMSDVLAPYSRFLTQIKPHVTPEEFQARRREAAMKNINQLIVRQLLVQAMTSKMKEEQIKGLEKYIDDRFNEDNVKIMMKRAKVNTVDDLDDWLRKDGTSLEQQRLEFRNSTMAHEYVVIKSTPKKGYDRPDLLAYYQEHLADFEYLGQVKWQQIVLDPQKHGGPEKTQKLAANIMDDLKSGKDFGELAKKHSQGATAKSGGVWNWTREGSLARADIEEKLFEMPVGQPCEPFKGPNGIEILRVIDRKDAGRQSFESVQGKIKQAILNENVRKGELTLVKDLMAKAVIEILFDKSIVFGGSEDEDAEEEQDAGAAKNPFANEK